MEKVFMTFFIGMFVILGIREYNEHPQKEECGFDYKAFEKGKSVGRNAMLQYLGSSQRKDVIKIDLQPLLHIEDSLSNDIIKKQDGKTN